MTVTNDCRLVSFTIKHLAVMISIRQRPVVAKKIDLNITVTIASYQRSK